MSVPYLQEVRLAARALCVQGVAQQASENANSHRMRLGVNFHKLMAVMDASNVSANSSSGSYAARIDFGRLSANIATLL